MFDSIVDAIGNTPLVSLIIGDSGLKYHSTELWC